MKFLFFKFLVWFLNFCAFYLSKWCYNNTAIGNMGNFLVIRGFYTLTKCGKRCVNV